MFEHSLIALDKKKSSRRRWLSLPIAVGLHLVALASFTFASYWHIESVPEPMEAAIYRVEVELQALPQTKIKQGSPAPVEQKTKAAAPTPEIAQRAEPTDAKLPMVVTPQSSGITVVDIPIDFGDPDGDPKGDSRGSKDGVEGVPFDPNGRGTGGGTQKAVAAPVSDEPIQVLGAVTRPVILDAPQPRYTETARRAGVQGTVSVEAVINEQGRVTDVRILKTLPMGLDRAAVDAVRSWRFKPATLDSKPVKVFYNLTVIFTLQR